MIRARAYRDTGAAVLFLLPLLVLVVALIAYPFGRAIWLSLTDKYVGYPERFVGLRNYLYLLHDDTFHEVVRNTLVFTAGSLALKVVTGLAMALVLSSVWRARSFFRGLFLLPWITPGAFSRLLGCPRKRGMINRKSDDQDYIMVS